MSAMIIEKFRSSTVTTVFVLPILKIGRKKLDSVGFIEAFLFNGEEQMVYDNCVHLLFRPSNMSKFNIFIEDEKEGGAEIVDENDYSDKLVLLTYKLPARFKEDIHKIWLGKYSTVSKEYRSAIPSTVKTEIDGILVTHPSAQHMVFDKHPALRRQLENELQVQLPLDSEVWTKPNIDKETFKIKNYESLTINA